MKRGFKQIARDMKDAAQLLMTYTEEMEAVFVALLGEEDTKLEGRPALPKAPYPNVAQEVKPAPAFPKETDQPKRMRYNVPLKRKLSQQEKDQLILLWKQSSRTIEDRRRIAALYQTNIFSVGSLIAVAEGRMKPLDNLRKTPTTA
jgi:hypothetical protein